MTRIEKILLRVRDTLADHKKERWSDDRLLRLVDEAQKDLCRRAKLLRSKCEFIVFDNKAYYEMPEDFLLLDKVSINKEYIPSIGHFELDKTHSKWEDMRGKVTHIVYDKQDRGNIRLFPIPDYSNGDRLKSVPSYQQYKYGKVREKYGIIIDLPKPGEFPSGKYGVTTDITGIFQWQEEIGGIPKIVIKDYTMGTKFGLVQDILFDVTPDSTIDSNFGVITYVDGFITEPFGIVSSIEGLEGYKVNFTDSFGEGVLFNVLEAPSYFTHFKKYGVITDNCHGGIDPFGVLTEFDFPKPENIVYSSPYGLTSEVTFIHNIMEVFYLRKPKEVISLESDPEIDSCFDNAIKYYVAGKALRDDLDAQNRSFGNEELQLYERELVEALTDDSSDFTRNNQQQLETTYNGWGY